MPPGPPPGPPAPSEAEQALPEIIQAVENLIQIVEQQSAKVQELEAQAHEMTTAMARMEGNYQTLTDIMRNPDPLLMYQRYGPKTPSSSSS